MQFIPVVSKMSNMKPNYTTAVIKQSKGCLFSLIDAFKQKEFGLDTLYTTRKYIRKYRKDFVLPHGSNLFIDSGGYSFIKGDISTNDIVKMIECYTTYLSRERENFDYIFSLDIPVNIKKARFNTKENIYKFNRISLEESLEVLKQHPMLLNKFYFVWQFRVKGQFPIWKQLYDELGLAQIIRNRAIGGMVGLKKAAGIEFSGFIALSFRCFKDYVDAQIFTHDFRLHLLGINSASDRFMIYIFEKLFQTYLDKIQTRSKAIITYDSINYKRSAYMNSRNLQVFSYENGNLIEYDKVYSVPPEIIKQVYFTEDLLDGVTKEIENLEAERKLNNSDAFVPINLYGILSQDRFFRHIIDSHRLADIFIQSKGIQRFKREMNYKLDFLSKHYPSVFTKNFNRLIMTSMGLTYRLHRRYYVENVSRDTIDEHVDEFIKMVKVPGELL